MAKSEVRESVHRDNIVEFGSDGHKALLGLAANMAPGSRADIEAQLKAVQTVMPASHSKRKQVVIDPRNYAPRTSRSDGDPIIDGWVRVGGRR